MDTIWNYFPDIAGAILVMSFLSLAVGLVRSDSDRKLHDGVVILVAFTSIIAIGGTLEFSHSGTLQREAGLLFAAIVFIAYSAWRLVARPYALILLAPIALGVFAFVFNQFSRDMGLSLSGAWIY